MGEHFDESSLALTSSSNENFLPDVAIVNSTLRKIEKNLRRIGRFERKTSPEVHNLGLDCEPFFVLFDDVPLNLDVSKENKTAGEVCALCDIENRELVSVTENKVTYEDISCSKYLSLAEQPSNIYPNPHVVSKWPSSSYNKMGKACNQNNTKVKENVFNDKICSSVDKLFGDSTTDNPSLKQASPLTQYTLESFANTNYSNLTSTTYTLPKRNLSEHNFIIQKALQRKTDVERVNNEVVEVPSEAYAISSDGRQTAARLNLGHEALTNELDLSVSFSDMPKDLTVDIRTYNETAFLDDKGVEKTKEKPIILMTSNNTKLNGIYLNDFDDLTNVQNCKSGRDCYNDRICKQLMDDLLLRICTGNDFPKNDVKTERGVNFGKFFTSDGDQIPHEKDLSSRPSIKHTVNNTSHTHAKAETRLLETEDAEIEEQHSEKNCKKSACSYILNPIHNIPVSKENILKKSMSSPVLTTSSNTAIGTVKIDVRTQALDRAVMLDNISGRILCHDNEQSIVNERANLESCQKTSVDRYLTKLEAQIEEEKTLANEYLNEFSRLWKSPFLPNYKK